MADDLLESNIVIKTKVARPNREGFKVLMEDTDKLKKKLTDLTSKAWIIKLQIDDSALKAYGLAKKVSTGNSGTGGPGGSSVLPVASPLGSGNPYYRRVSVTDNGVRDLQRTRQLVGAKQVTNTVVTDETGSTVKLVTEELDLFEKTIQGRLKANANSLRSERRVQARVAAADARQTRREAQDYTRQSFNNIAGGNLNTQVNQALAGGFREQAPTRFYNARTGEFSNIRNLVRTTGNAFTGYTVEVLKANEATRRMTIETLTGSRAMRFLGDSVQNAISKVLLWSTATTAVFAAAGAIRQAAIETAKLEENTVLLARVGQNFAGGASDFESRYQAAKNLTNQIVELTTIYGGNAAAAQEAAAIFARAGRNEQETLEATRVALISTRIAELDVGEAAKLLSSAMLQFNLQATDLLPTLDSLNTLSNRYRVTTNDLLQSISRTGAVYAEHNGRLNELAAVTAVVSQTTSRTGAEIGNALKTISSNLDRVDTQTALFEKLGVSTVNYEGDARSLGDIVFDLRNRFDDLAASEEKQLTLQIAGVRQRNILIAAIKNADEALIAENRSLLEAGSATKEFYESSTTLISALQRLIASLTQIAHQGNSAFGPVVKGLVNVLDFGLRTLTLFNGLPVKIITTVGGFYLLHRAMLIAMTSLRTYMAALTGTVAIQQAQTAANIQQAVSLGILQRAYVATTVAARGFVASGGLVTVGLVAGVALLGSYAEASNTVTDSIKASNIELEQNITAEENRRTAILNTAAAVNQLVQRYEELKQAGKEAEAEEVKKRGLRIGGSAGLDLSSGNFNTEGLVNESVRAQQSSVAKERTLLEQQRQQRQDAVAQAFSNQRSVLDYNNYIRNPPTVPGFQLQETTNRIRALHFGGEESRERVLRELREREVTAEQAVAKALRERRELESQIKNLKEQQFEVDKSIAQQQQASANLIKDRLRFEAVEFSEKLRKSQDEGDPVGTFQRLTAAYKEIETASDIAIENTKALLDLYDRGVVTEELAARKVEQTNKLLEKRRDLAQQIYYQQQQASERASTSVLGSRARLLERGGLLGIETDRRLSNASPYGDELAGLGFRFQQQLDRLRVARRVARSAQNEDGPEAAGRIRAAQLESQTAIVNLKDIEAERTLAILESEKEIAIERKKSADEAARAVGALSTEDKLRVLTLSDEFARNPNKRFSIDEQLLLNEKTGRLIQQFFPSKFENLSEARGPLADTLRKAGLGLSPEVLKGSAEIAAARGGRTDGELINKTLARIEELDRKLSASQGVPLVGSSSFQNALRVGAGNGVNAAGKVDTRLTIDVRDGLDLQPLLDAVQDVILERMNEKVDDAANQFRRILQEEQALNKRVIPKTAVRSN